MSTIKVAFFWHMHQPSYKDPLSNTYILPWIRLHSIKEYYDMVRILDRFPDVHQTFNLVPSLLNQLIDYTDHDADDLFLRHCQKSASDLTLNERIFLLKNSFMCNWDNMIQPYPRYWNLLKKRGTKKMDDSELAQVDRLFTPQDYLDLQVWFNLTWFGYSALKDKPELVEIKKKGRYFTEEDKQFVLNSQFEIMKKIIPAYKKAADKGQIELTTSPFYHPILPLLIDTDFALRNSPDDTLPQRMQFDNDAGVHIKNACEFHKKLFGKSPSGLWPSEGSVAPEIIPYLKENNIEWIATDEDILLNSGLQGEKGRLLYNGYKAIYYGKAVNIVFRDRGLSDLIGFTYAKNDPESAAGDLINNISSIHRYTQKHNEDSCVFIILDGENPWENFYDGGENFLSALYEKISAHNEIKAVSIGEYLKANPPTKKINNLYSGSWIGHNFKVWIGHEEDNQGWEYIYMTRSFLKDYIQRHPDLPKETIKAAWEEIYTAQGSDWFWWYGEDFSSDSDEEFDRLFRSHLEKVYLLLNVDIPEKLRIPIKKTRQVEDIIEPSGFISPIIDGMDSNYFEWMGAGLYSLKEQGKTMFQGKRYFSDIYYGFDPETLYLRIDPVKHGDTFLKEEFTIDIHFYCIGDYKISFECSPYKKKSFFNLYEKHTGGEISQIGEFYTVAIKDMVELSIPFSELKLKETNKVKFALCLLKNNIEIERYPRERSINFTVPSKNFEKIMWSAI